MELDGKIIGIISNAYEEVDYSGKKVEEIITYKMQDALKMVKLDESIKSVLFDDLSSRDKNKVILASHLHDKEIRLVNFSKGMIKKDLEYFNNLHILPSNINLSGAEIELVDKDNREYLFKNILEPIINNYDYILIDCPPSLNILTVNALVAANTILVPLQCEYYALEGLSQLLYTINLVKQKLNPSLKIEGIVFTMYDARTNLSLQVVEEVKEYLGKNVYKSIIPRNVRLSEAPSHGKPINLYDSKCKGAEAYMLLADEVILNKEA